MLLRLLYHHPRLAQDELRGIDMIEATGLFPFDQGLVTLTLSIFGILTVKTSDKSSPRTKLRESVDIVGKMISSSRVQS
jgi:hypothetical protein